MPDRIRMVVCDDHTLVREGLRRVLLEDPAIDVIADVGTSADVIEACRRHRPDIVLLDVTLPDGSGIAAIQKITEVSPDSRILMLTMHEDVAYLREAFAEGAMGYVLKAAADVELLHAVHEVRRGVRYVHPTLGAALLEPPPVQAGEGALVSNLSEREKEILRYLSLGYTNPEMAEMLSLSVRTVETYRWRLQQKVGLRSRAELVRLAREAGLVQ
ncbi:response regulator transcription factor [Sporichthya sp.]|uniref:response regulator n=1 Tax=Sporichthya sp. TaxID=65475 RepID=UPI00180BC7DB|nr:response regulator transcription factor [Sporichthya sp.]MBA3744533.1 response regulator transcription factor [Sporichthya sp.]